MRRATLLAFCGASVLLAPAVARAQSAQEKADAEALFNAGKAALAAGNLAEACPKFAASQSKDPAIGTALYLAECYERSGKIASAWAQFHQAEDMANQRHDNRGSLAKSRADRLAPSHVTITLAPGAQEIAGLEVKRDGQTVGAALIGLASPIDGGHHVIVASAPGRLRFEWSGDIPEQRGAVTVTIPKLEPQQANVASTNNTTSNPQTSPTPPPTSTPSVVAGAGNPPTPEHSGGGLGSIKIAGIVVGAVGLAGIGVSSIMGVVAHDNYQSVLTKNGNGTCIDPTSGGNANCTSGQDASTANTAKALADAGTAVFIAGGALVVVGVVMFLVAPKPKPTALALSVTPMVGPQGCGAFLSGRF